MFSSATASSIDLLQTPFTPEVQTIESIVVLIVIATVVGLLSNRLRLPYTVSLVLVGIGMAYLGIVPHLELTRDLLVMIFLPALLFEAAIHFPANELKDQAVPIATLAAPGVLLTALGTAFVLQLEFATFRLSQPGGFAYFLLFGAIIAATDPVSVIALMRQLGVGRELSVVLEGESLFNDGTAIVLFMVVLDAMAVGTFSLNEGIAKFIIVAVGGILVGSLLGLFSSLIIKYNEDHLIAIALTIVTAYGSYLIAEEIHVSGILATVTAGLFVGNIGKKKGMSPHNRIAVVSFWEYIAFFISSIIFLLIGLEVKLSILVDEYLLVLLAFCAVLASRALAVYLPIPFLNKTKQRVSVRSATALWWGGLRGSLSMVLALSLPDTLPGRDALIAMTFGVVVLSVVVQGTTMGYVLKLLGLVAVRNEAVTFLGKSLARLRAIQARQDAISKLAAQEAPGLKDLSEKLHTERMDILHELDRRKDDPAFAKATSARIELVQKHLEQIARDSLRESLQTHLITEEEVEDLMSSYERPENSPKT